MGKVGNYDDDENIAADDKVFGTDFLTGLNKNYVISSLATWLEGNINLVQKRIVVTQANFATTLGGTIDSTKEYFIDGAIDMGSTSITVPTTGLTLRGHSFDISGLYSTENSYTMFISEDPGTIGSGNVLGQDYYVSVTGTGSKVYELYDETGFNAFEFIRVNYNDCVSLGDLHGYRQGLELGTGRFGGAPSLTLHGTWVGGYRITTSIVRSMSDTTTEPLFKAGTAFSMASRFLSDINCDLGDLQPFCDFAPTNFVNPSTVQLQGCIMTRGGVADAGDTNVLPNLLPSDLVSIWNSNIGITNTFIGGIKNLTTEVETVIAGIDTFTALLGTWTDDDVQHFDSPENNSFRHLGTDPKDFRVTFDFVIEGTQGEEYRIKLIKDSGGVLTSEFTQLRTIDRLAGNRDVSYFTGVFGVTMDQNDKLYWEIENIDSSANCTIEIDSQWFVEAR